MDTKITDPSRRSPAIRAAAFIALVLASAFLGPILGGTPTNPGPGFILWGIAPAAVAMILRTATGDWGDAGFRPRFREKPRYWALTFALPPLLMSLTTFVSAAIGAVSIGHFDPGIYLSKVAPGAAVFAIFAVFEEVGWRGYLVPKLAAAMAGDYARYAVVGVVWTVWHLPFIADLAWVYEPGNFVVFMPLFLSVNLAYSAFYHELRLATGSVWPAVAFHALSNALQHPFARDYVTIAPGMEFLGRYTGIIMTTMLVAAAYFLRRTRLRPSSVRRG